MALRRLARSEKWVEERNRGVDWRSHTSFFGEHFISNVIQSWWIKYFPKKKNFIIVGGMKNYIGYWYLQRSFKVIICKLAWIAII